MGEARARGGAAYVNGAVESPSAAAAAQMHRDVQRVAAVARGTAVVAVIFALPVSALLSLASLSVAIAVAVPFVGTLKLVLSSVTVQPVSGLSAASTAAAASVTSPVNPSDPVSVTVIIEVVASSVAIVVLSTLTSTRGAASIWQLEEQPSPDTVLPSSHVSPGSITPLPQLGGVTPSSPVPGLSPTVHPTNVNPRRVAKVEVRMVLHTFTSHVPKLTYREL